MGQRLGQHFLINRDKLGIIANALELKADSTVIEIGPGHGELTESVRCQVSGVRIIAIEKDRELAGFLRKKFVNDKNIEIVEGDALEVLPQLVSNYKLQTTNYKLVGNIPYYITGYLMRIIGELENKPELAVFLIQKEVAERICGHANSARLAKASRNANAPMRITTKPEMNLLAASIQFWADPEIVDYVSREDFDPPPDVESAIIRLVTNNQQLTADNIQQTKKVQENYYKLIKILFKQPRKTILNNLRDANIRMMLRPLSESDSGRTNDTNDADEIKNKLVQLGIKPDDRPQNLSVEDIKKLAAALFNA